MTISDELRRQLERHMRFRDQADIDREIEQHWTPRLERFTLPCPADKQYRYFELIRSLSREYTRQEIEDYLQRNDIHEAFPLGIDPGQDWDDIRELANILEAQAAASTAYSKSQSEIAKHSRRGRVKGPVNPQLDEIMQSQGLSRSEAVKRLAKQYSLTPTRINQILREES